MKQELWALAFILALVKTRLDFYGEVDRDGEEFPLFHNISKAFHETPSSGGSLRKSFSLRHSRNSTSTDNIGSQSVEAKCINQGHNPQTMLYSGFYINRLALYSLAKAILSILQDSSECTSGIKYQSFSATIIYHLLAFLPFLFHSLHSLICFLGLSPE